MALNATIQTNPPAPPPGYLLIYLATALIGLKVLALSVYTLACSFRSARSEEDPAKRALLYVSVAVALLVILSALIFALAPRHG